VPKLPHSRHCSLSCNSRAGRDACAAASGWGESVEKVCAHCGILFVVQASEAPTAKYCSRDCHYAGKRGVPTKMLSERALVEYTCQECNKRWLDKRCLAHRKKFCCRTCAAISRVRANQEGQTTIETETYAALSALGVVFLPQHRLGRFLVDAYLPGLNIVVECLGDFWHTNPAVYPDGPTCYVQRQGVTRDVKRFAWLADNRYGIMKLWEQDIRRDGARALIEKALALVG